jgi:hypothetical protein
MKGREMKKILYIFMIGMALTVLQTTTAIAQAPVFGTDCNAEPTEALKKACFENKSTGHNPGDGEDCAGMPTPEEVAACWDRQPAPAGPHDGMAPPMDGAHDGMAPPAEEGGEALPIDDPRCIVEPKARDYRCPGFVGP